MTIPFFQVDAFAERPMGGNPAAVMLLKQWLDDAALQAIAAENNVSETAFVVPLAHGSADYQLRWFSPTVEVQLCGHATLATAHVLIAGETIRFATRSGILTAERDGELLWIDLPAEPVEPGSDPALLRALRIADGEVWRGMAPDGSRIVILPNEQSVRAVEPDFAALAALDALVMVTAPGDDHAIASRVFAAHYGVPEDPATGAAHCALVPLWAKRLRRDHFSALQASRRGGLLQCRLDKDRVKLGGRCFTVIEGNFKL